VPRRRAARLRGAAHVLLGVARSCDASYTRSRIWASALRFPRVKITYAELSAIGPVRPHNEDFVKFWESEAEQVRKTRGAVSLLADGVGGHGDGEVASRLAVETALRIFREADPTTTDNQLLWRMFNAANLTVYDAGMARGGADRMATTLTVALFRRNEVAIGHVGDSRAYLVRQGQIRQLTADHTYVAMQLKMSLISKEDAMASELRGVLTRSIGQNPTIQVDYARSILRGRDIVIQCTDGLHGCVSENELRDSVSHMGPAEACEHLVRLAEKRGTEDNISVQILRVDNVQRVGYYRGSVAYYAPLPTSVANELQVGQVLDERFEITDVISRSGMSSVFKAIDLKTGLPVALKVPLLRLESDPAFFSRFEREEEIGRALDHPGILKIVPVDAKERSRPYLVMEYLDGQTLDEVMQRVKPMPETSSRRTSCSATTGRCGSWISESPRRPRAAGSRSAASRPRSGPPTTWHRSRSKVSAETNERISTAWARFSTRC
jgi:serine/threonine protein phosphatase PrpC